MQGPSSFNGTGRLEVYHDGQWGTICDDRWDINDARVACRQLGYRNTLGALQGVQVPSGSGQIWLDEVDCNGTEQNLSSCLNRRWGSHNCLHSEDAGVKCTQEGDFTKQLLDHSLHINVAYYHLQSYLHSAVCTCG